jgi:hypothetical protein
MVLHPRRSSARLSPALVDCMSNPAPLALPKPLFQSIAFTAAEKHPAVR